MVKTVAESHRHTNSGLLPNIDFAGKAMLPSVRVEFPVHLEVAGQVLPAIGRAHVTA